MRIPLPEDACDPPREPLRLLSPHRCAGAEHSWTSSTASPQRSSASCCQHQFLPQNCPIQALSAVFLSQRKLSREAAGAVRWQSPVTIQREERNLCPAQKCWASEGVPWRDAARKTVSQCSTRPRERAENWAGQCSGVGLGWEQSGRWQKSLFLLGCSSSSQVPLPFSAAGQRIRVFCLLTLKLQLLFFHIYQILVPCTIIHLPQRWLVLSAFSS